MVVLMQPLQCLAALREHRPEHGHSCWVLMSNYYSWFFRGSLYFNMRCMLTCFSELLFLCIDSGRLYWMLTSTKDTKEDVVKFTFWNSFSTTRISYLLPSFYLMTSIPSINFWQHLWNIFVNIFAEVIYWIISLVVACLKWPHAKCN